MIYRPEIDGLRAVAVVPVILFHAGFGLFAGGYVGVDVFFVISGYLITSIIIAEMHEGRFSLLRFYERRARRILPALFLVVLCSLPLAWIVLLPGDMREFAQSLVAVSTFSANFFFWMKSGYFAGAAELKPMLHMWSLAVEEQFYIVFPLLLIVTWRFGGRAVVSVLAALFLISLGLAQWGAHRAPSSTFYLLHSRAWELLIGSFAAFYLRRGPVGTSHRANQVLSAAGLAAIVYAIFAYDGQTPFPSLYALVPTLGTLLLILFATPGTAVHALLSLRGFVGVGLLSYSLYLWHQPLLAFYRHWRAPELFEIWAIIAATFVLSAVTFHFVERPARTASGGPRAVLGLSAVPLAALAAVGLTGHLNQGFPSRFNPQLTAAIVEARSDSPVYIEHNRYDDDRCRFSATHSDTETRTRIHACHERYGPGVLIFGDSHATNLYHAVIRNSRAASHPFVVGLSENGCHLPHAPASCHYEGVLDLISSDAPPFSHVVYEKAGHQMLHRPSAANREDARSAIRDDARAADIVPYVARIEGVIDFLRDASPSVEIVWFGPRMEPLVREEELYEDDCEMDLGFARSHKRAFHGLDAFLDDRLSQEQAIRYISQIEAFDFSFPRDLGTCDALYWMDLNHFSAAGEAEFGSRFDLVSYLTDNPDLNGAAAE